MRSCEIASKGLACQRAGDMLITRSVAERRWTMQGQDLNELIRIASKIEMLPGDQELQRRSFAYGNTKVENSDMTHEAIDKAAGIIAAEDSL